MKRIILALFVTSIAIGPSVTEAEAAIKLDTAVWSQTGTPPYSALTGNLDGNTISVSTVAVLNAGLVLPSNNWSGILGGTVTTSSDSAIAIATSADFSTTLQKISFATAVVNPYLLFNYTDPTSAISFAGLTIAPVYASAGVQITGTNVAFVGSSDYAGNAFAVEVIGTFTTLSFAYTDSTSNINPIYSGNSLGFTVGLATVPEPSSLSLCAIAIGSAVGFAGYRRRNSRV